MEANEFINEDKQVYEEASDYEHENDYGYGYEQGGPDTNETSDASTTVGVKVSTDDGQTWERRRVNMADGLDESGLVAGELFVFNGEKYRVLEAEYGLKVELLKKQTKAKKRK